MSSNIVRGRPQQLNVMKMIDIHAHILPAVDDGSPSLATSIEMLRIAEDNGVREIIATPHIIEIHKALSWSEILIRTQELQQRAQMSGLKIKIHAGAELEMNWDLLALLEQGTTTNAPSYCLAGSRYLLLELPGSSIPKYADEFLFEVQIRGFIPILAHPERHPLLMDNLLMLGRWRQSGLLVQSNAGSFTGLYGERAKRNVEYLLAEQLVDFVASDAHNVLHRTPAMLKCAHRLTELSGHDAVQSLMYDAPARLVQTSVQQETEPTPDAHAAQLMPEHLPHTNVNVAVDEQKQVHVRASWAQESAAMQLANINEAAVREYLQKARHAERIKREYTNCSEALKNLGLLKNGKLLNIAGLMFGHNPELELQLAIFASDKRLTFNDIKRVSGNIPELIAAAEKYIKNNIRWRVVFDGSLQRREVPEIPLDAIREALVNSFCHRDYSLPENNEVSIYNNRIEIYSAGQFPSGLEPDDFIKGAERSVQRNPLLAKILYYSRDVESFGTGLKRIDAACRRENIKVEFKMLKTGFVVIIYKPRNNNKKNKKQPEQLSNLFYDS